ncbi:MAG: hypothetical protein AABM66_07225 [Actinomycetota bacterium]
MAGADFNQAVRRLAQYRPFNEGGRDIQAAIRDLALAAAAVADGRFDSLHAAREAIGALWGLDVELEELRSVVDELAERGEVTRSNGGFGLSRETAYELTSRADESSAVESEALLDWERRIRRDISDLGEDEWSSLCDDLRTWLNQVIARHGVESALVLYPENPRTQQLFDAIEKMGLSFLPSRGGRVDDIRDWAFQMFVREPTPAQRTYLAGLLNTAFYITVLTTDPEASRLVQERVAGHRVYLDTNFIYALLGLGVTASEALSAARLIQLTKEVGYQLVVTQWTIDELRTSLKAAERRLSRLPLPRRDLAHLLTMRAGENQITKAYWMRYRDSGIQPKDFLEYYSHVETLLSDFEISLVTEGCLAVDRAPDAISEQLSLLDRSIGLRDKEDVVKEHDVKHRLLIERLRGDGHVTFSNARFWFLTRDTKLPRYAMRTVGGDRVDLPFCVGTSAWVQVMRAFIPRTEDFDKSLVELLATPYLRYGRGPGVSPSVVDAVVARVDQYKGATPGLAAEVLADTALAASIAAAESEADRDAKIENAFIMKAEELEKRADESERREAELRLKHQEAEVAAKRAATERRAEASRLEEVSNALERSRQAQEEATEEATAQSAEAERLVAELRAHVERSEARERTMASDVDAERTERRRAERRGQVLGAGLITVLSILLAVVPLASGWITEAVPAVVVLSVGALGLCGAIRLGLGHEQGPRVLSVMFGFSGIVGLIVALVLAVTSGD